MSPPESWLATIDAMWRPEEGSDTQAVLRAVVRRRRQLQRRRASMSLALLAAGLVAYAGWSWPNDPQTEDVWLGSTSLGATSPSPMPADLAALSRQFMDSK